MPTMNKTPMPHVTCYLTEDLRSRAKRQGLNLSKILREGIVRELAEGAQPKVEVRRVGDTLEVVASIPVDVLPR